MKFRINLVILTLFMIMSSTFVCADTILFICGGNTGRSPMAEVLANQYFDFEKDNYVSISRGVNINPQEILPEKNAIAVMNELINTTELEKHRARAVTAQDINRASLVLTMTEQQKEKLLVLDPEAANKIYTLSQCAMGITMDIPDAYRKDLDFYRLVRNEISNYLLQIKEHDFHCAI